MMLNKTFHLLLLSLIPLLGFSQANSQYPDSGNKIRLGFQTTGDGLIWRDTQPNVGVYQPINNKAAWIVLDTVNNKFYHYKNSAWTLAGGQDIDTANLIATKYNLGFKLSLADTATMLLPYYRNGRALGTPSSATLTNATGLPLTTGVTGTLAVANGGTNITTFTAANRIPYASSATALTTSSNLTYNNSTLVVGNENDNYDNLSLKNKATTSNTNRRAGLTANTYEGDSLVGIMSVFAGASDRSLVFGGGVSNLKNPTDITFYTSTNVENPADRGSRHRMYINNIGDIGLGTLSPTEKLHVVGNGLFTGNLSLGTPLTVANGGTGASVRTFVDTINTQTVNGLKTFTDTVRIEDAIKVGANNAYVYSAGTGNYYFTKDYKNQSGLYTIAIGDGVLKNATTVSNPASSRVGTIAIGYNNLQNMVQTASSNNAVWNTSIGYNNMSSVTTGGFNTAVGANALRLLTTGGSNVAIGTLTLENMTTGGSNLGLGDNALRFASSGSNNIGIGSNAGIFDVNGNQVTSIDNSIYIGQRADPSSTTGVTNEVVIGYLAKGQGSNSVTFGNTSTTKTILNGDVGIGTASPTARLQVKGSANASEFALKVDDSGSNTLLSVQNNSSIKFQYGTGGATLTDGIAIKRFSPDVAGRSTMEISGTSSDWVSGKGLVFNNHTLGIIFGAQTHFSSAVSTSQLWIGDSQIGSVDDFIVFATGTSGFVDISATKYAGGPYPNMRISAPNISFFTKTAATWPDGGATSAYGTEIMTLMGSSNIKMNSVVYNNTTTSTTRTLFIGGDYTIGGISSIRASKKNIENVSNVDWLYELNPVTFNYRKKDLKGNYSEEVYEDKNYGLIAEDTKLIADFLINYNDKEDGTKEMIGIEYSRLITPLLKAVQELSAEIDILKQEIINLKNK